MNKYTPEDILSRLQAGETMDQLAQEFTDALNAAKALQEEEIKKAEAEALVACQRRDAMPKIVLAIGSYIENFGSQEQKDYFSEYETKLQADNAELDKLCDSMDSILELAVALDGLTKVTFPLQKLEKPVEEKKEDCACGKCRPVVDKKKEYKNSDEMLADFLNVMGW